MTIFYLNFSLADVFITLSTSFIYGVHLAEKLQPIIYTAWSMGAIIAFFIDSVIFGYFGMFGLKIFLLCMNVWIINILDQFENSDSI